MPPPHVSWKSAAPGSCPVRPCQNRHCKCRKLEGDLQKPTPMELRGKGLNGSLSNIRSVSHYGNASGVTDRRNIYNTTSADYGRPIATAIRESRLPVYKPQLPAVSSFSLSSPWRFRKLAQQTSGIICLTVYRRSRKVTSRTQYIPNFCWATSLRVR